MAVYRFRISFEDNDEVFREIEIKSTQNFEDFHDIIVQSINFDNVHDASFFISDDQWRKGDEISRYGSKVDDKKPTTEPAKKQMSKCKMASLIDDPHQKFVYVYDPKTAWTFLIELLKIVPDDMKASYPKCAKTGGDMPKQYKKVETGAPVVDDDDDFDDGPHTDDAAYVASHNVDEIAVLEGEEGEEGEEAMAEAGESDEEEESAEGGGEEDL